MIERNKLGTSELFVSKLGVGCNAFGTRIDADQTLSVVDAAIAEGINFFDTADTYGRGTSEELLGRSLGKRRGDVIVATKFGMSMQGDNGPETARASKTYMRTAVEASLRRLGTDYIDLYQLHTPDRATPLADTIGAMNELVDEGKVRAIGCSNFAAFELMDADWTARHWGFAPFVTSQNEYSLLNRTAEVELAPACSQLGVGLLPYFPLAYGLLTGKYRRGKGAPQGSRLDHDSQKSRLESADWDLIEKLEEFANARDLTVLDVAIGGLAAKPAVTSVIAGATRPEQIKSNAAALQWEPSVEDVEELAAIGAPQQSYTSFAPWRRD